MIIFKIVALVALWAGLIAAVCVVVIGLLSLVAAAAPVLATVVSVAVVMACVCLGVGFASSRKL